MLIQCDNSALSALFYVFHDSFVLQVYSTALIGTFGLKNLGENYRVIGEYQGPETSNNNYILLGNNSNMRMEKKDLLTSIIINYGERAFTQSIKAI